MQTFSIYCYLGTPVLGFSIFNILSPKKVEVEQTLLHFWKALFGDGPRDAVARPEQAVCCQHGLEDWRNEEESRKEVKQSSSQQIPARKKSLCSPSFSGLL